MTKPKFNPLTSSWTEERNMLLSDLWTRGLTASEIAVQLGGVSRNAVIGKAHRLNLEPRSQKYSGRTSERRRRAKARLNIFTIIPPLFDDEPLGAANRPIVGEQGAAACQWPHGDPGASNFGFCGAKLETGRPYCPKHVARAYLPLDGHRGR